MSKMRTLTTPLSVSLCRPAEEPAVSALPTPASSTQPTFDVELTEHMPVLCSYRFGYWQVDRHIASQMRVKPVFTLISSAKKSILNIGCDAKKYIEEGKERVRVMVVSGDEQVLEDMSGVLGSVFKPPADSL